jgi:hypothetical protein
MIAFFRQSLVLKERPVLGTAVGHRLREWSGVIVMPFLLLFSTSPTQVSEMQVLLSRNN